MWYLNYYYMIDYIVCVFLCIKVKNKIVKVDKDKVIKEVIM